MIPRQNRLNRVMAIVSRVPSIFAPFSSLGRRLAPTLLLCRYAVLLPGLPIPQVVCPR